MDPNASTTNTSQPEKRSSKTVFFTLFSLLILATVVVITLFLYIKNKQNYNKDKTTPKITTAKPSPIPPNTPNAKETTKKMAENLKKYGVVCKRFTSLDEALKTPEIACVLDLSGQNLITIPKDIAKLTILNDLNLSNNKLTKFPVELLEIKSLMGLNLSNNNISSIPSNTVIPPNIQILNLSANKLSASEMEKYQRIPGTPPPLPTLPSKK